MYVIQCLFLSLKMGYTLETIIRNIEIENIAKVQNLSSSLKHSFGVFEIYHVKLYAL